MLLGLIPKTENKIYISNYSVDNTKPENKLFNNNISWIENAEVNESLISIGQKNTSSFNQRINLSTEDKSYQTYYQRPEKITNLTTHTDEDKSLM